jgi:hypothetical protein
MNVWEHQAAVKRAKKDKAKKRKRTWKELNPDKRRESLWRKLDLEISFADFLDMWVAQDFRCKICSDRVTISAHLDHDHSSGRARGILCKTCNMGLGVFFDSPMLLRNAAAYILDYAGYRPFDKSAEYLNHAKKHP